jgi:hypothetical protein
MNELHWTPREIAQLTIAQLACLCSKKPPRSPPSPSLQ